MDDSATTIEPVPAHIVRTADIVVAYVASNSMPIADLPALIVATHAAIVGLGRAAPPEPAVDKPTPAQIRTSITHEALISFEDGRPYKALRRHLTNMGTTPEAYRAKWGLAVDYPMIAPGYSEARSALAKSLGLGGARRKPVKAAPAPAPAAEKPKRPGRPRKAREPAEA